MNLDIKTNRLTTLKGVEFCENLMKIDASNNNIAVYDGLKDFKANRNKI